MLGRRATLEADVSLGTDATIGRAAVVGARTVADTSLTLGYGASIGADSVVGGNVTLGALATLDDEVILGDGAVVARGVSVGSGGGVYGIVGPDSTLAGGASLEPSARMRKGADLGENARVLAGARIGRSAMVGSGAVVGRGARVGAHATIAAGAVVPEDAVVRRGVAFDSADGSPGTASECPENVVVSSGLFHHSYDDPADPLNDSTANNNDGVGSVGTSNGHATFSGSQVYTVPGTGNMDWSGGLSASVWIRWSGRSGSYRGVVNNGYFTGGSFEIRFGRESGGTRLGVVTNGPSGQRIHPSVYLNQNQWYHVALVHGADGVWRAYVNGAVLHEVTGVTWMPKTVSTRIHVGNNGGGGEYYAGDVEDVRVYNYGLTESEVLALYADAP